MILLDTNLLTRTLCFYRARRRHALQRAQQRTGNRVNIAIMGAFVRLREILATHKDLARKLDEHERRLGEHDERIHVVFEAIRQLMAPSPAPKRRRIGFAAELDDAAGAQIAEQAKRKRNAKVRQG